MTALKYWEDVAESPQREFGPLQFSSVLLEQLLELLGEKHPIHHDEEFAKSISRERTIVPGGFLHSFAAGHVAQHGGPPLAIIGIRTMNFDFVRPLYPDTAFFFSTSNEESQEVDEKMGMISSVRRFYYENNKTIAIIRMNYAILRRPAV